MVDNPYTPSNPEEQVAQKILGKIRIAGGPVTVTLVGLVAGYAINQGYQLRMGTPFIPLAVPAGCMFLASSVCVPLIRGTMLSAGMQITLILLSSLACWLLFFPVCIASGVGAMEMGFRGHLEPDETGLLFACLIASSIVLNFVFWFLLLTLRKRRRQVD